MDNLPSKSECPQLLKAIKTDILDQLKSESKLLETMKSNYLQV